MLHRALDQVFAASEECQVVIVAPVEFLGVAREIGVRVASARSKAANPRSLEFAVVAGADTRQGSVVAGLAALDAGVSIVLVHDAARAMTPSGMFDQVISAVRDTGHGVVPTLPVTDTIKRVAPDGTVIGTVEREELAYVQTPQGFPRQQLEAAYGAAVGQAAPHRSAPEVIYTDDAALFAGAGHPVDWITGDPLAFKITTAWDLRRARALIAEQEGNPIRIGIGVDVHAYDSKRPLWLGGLLWPHEPGLAGHSDGDALSHAMCDALLSAAGLGDVGSRFGTDDPRFAGAHGDVFLQETMALVHDAGYSVGNVAVQLTAQHPRIGSRRDELEQHLSALVGAPVSVAATTTDGLGFTGRGEGIAVTATALVHPRR